jgi:translation initiation factor IF-1
LFNVGLVDHDSKKVVAINASKQAKMPKNLTGGSGHKKGTKASQGWRGAKAKEAAADLLELLEARARVGLKALTMSEAAALQVLQVGRIDRMLGGGRCDVLCEDNAVRRCAIRGVLRSKKGGAHMSVGTIVTVSLERPLDDLGESDDEGTVKRVAPAGGAGMGGAYVVGIFDESAKRELTRAGVNPVLFKTVDGSGAEVEDGNYSFDAEGGTVDLPRRARKLAESEARRKAAAAAAGGGDADTEEGEVDLDIL